MEFILLAVIIFIVFAVLFVNNKCMCKEKYTAQKGGRGISTDSSGSPTPSAPSFPILNIDIKNAVDSNITSINEAITGLQEVVDNFKDNTLSFSMNDNLNTNITTAVTKAKTALETTLSTLQNTIKSNLKISI